MAAVIYLDHFGLDEPPFRITPHTDFFFDGADRGLTLEALLYAILHDEGIVKVSGEVGSGKTMLCRVLMERLPESVEIVYLANPSLAREEILDAIADDLEIDVTQGRITVALRQLEEHLIDLYADGRRVVVMIDEAHAMPEDTLEQVRLLSNLESNRHKLLQIVLFGQPELDAVLDKPSMRQLKDRITHSFRMRPLTEAEVGPYLSFRMRAAGYRGPDIFVPRTVSMITKAAKGLTRRVNILADKSLLAAYSQNMHAVSPKEVRAAIRDSEFGRLAERQSLRPAAFFAAALVAGIGLGAALQWYFSPAESQSQAAKIKSSPTKNTSTAATGPLPAAANAAAKSEPEVPAEALATVDKVIAATPAATIASVVPASTAPAKPAPEAPGTPKLGQEAATRLAAYRAGTNKLLRTRLEATRDKLDQEKDDNYSIELFSTDNSDPDRLERFLVRAKQIVELKDIYVIPERNGSKYRIRVVYGNYPDRAAATQAVATLPQKYKETFQAEPRSFAELRALL